MIRLTVAAGCSFCAVSLSYSHDPDDEKMTITGKFVQLGATHENAHGIEQVGRFWMNSRVLGPAEIHEIDGREEIVTTKPWSIHYAGFGIGYLPAIEPLEGSETVPAQRVSTNPPLFRAYAAVAREWKHKGAPFPYIGTFGLKFDNQWAIAQSTDVAHVPKRMSPETAVAATIEDTLSASYIAAFERDANDALLLDGEGMPIPVLDADGRQVFEDAPQPLLRLTSDAVSGSTTTTIRYTLQNYTEFDRTFVIASVTTPLFPAGWTGTVESESSTFTEFEVANSDTIFTQQSRCDTLSVDEITSGIYDEAGFTADVLVPRSRLQCASTAGIGSVTYTAQVGNIVTFTVADAPAAWAALLRVGAAGIPHVASTMQGPISTAAQHELIDEAPPPGENTYLVLVGVGINFQTSDNASVQN